MELILVVVVHGAYMHCERFRVWALKIGAYLNGGVIWLDFGSESLGRICIIDLPGSQWHKLGADSWTFHSVYALLQVKLVGVLTRLN
jgi:hypothetical protein